MVTRNELYLEMRRALIDDGSLSPQLEAREILSAAVGKPKAEVLAGMSLYMNDESEETARLLLERRLKGEPLAYILGKWDFYGLELEVNSSVLIPRQDTEVLAERVIEYIKPHGRFGRVLDLCTGSGCIGIAVAVNAPECKLVLADNSDKALAVCRKNVLRHTLGGRALCVKLDALETPPAFLGKFDVIACNPPYIAESELDTLDDSVRLYEPRAALDGGADGLKFYRSVCSLWKSVLHPEGRLLFEIGEGQREQASDILSANGFTIRDILKDTAGIERVVVGEPYIQ